MGKKEAGNMTNTPAGGKSGAKDLAKDEKRAGAGWIAYHPTRGMHKSRWFNARRWGSWRLAFVLARLQRQAWELQEDWTPEKEKAQKAAGRVVTPSPSGGGVRSANGSTDGKAVNRSKSSKSGVGKGKYVRRKEAEKPKQSSQGDLSSLFAKVAESAVKEGVDGAAAKKLRRQEPDEMRTCKENIGKDSGGNDEQHEKKDKEKGRMWKKLKKMKHKSGKRDKKEKKDKKDKKDKKAKKEEKERKRKERDD